MGKEVTLQTVSVKANPQTEKQIIICMVCMSYDVSIETKQKKTLLIIYTLH